jgi:TolB protein
MMDRNGEGKWRLTNSADDAMPSWSPTGDRIAYASQRNGNWNIWVINTDGSGQAQLTHEPSIDAMPVWLPDGSGIAFRSTRDGAWGIWVMDADGGNPRKITDAPAAPDWGRDRLDVY